MIYAIQAMGTPYIKFGHSTEANVNDRLGMLQTGCPFELDLLAVGIGGREEEQRIHLALKAAKRHYSREWFIDSEETRQWIDWIAGRGKSKAQMPAMAEGRRRLDRVLEYAANHQIERFKPKARREIISSRKGRLLSRTREKGPRVLAAPTLDLEAWRAERRAAPQLCDNEAPQHRPIIAEVKCG